MTSDAGRHNRRQKDWFDREAGGYEAQWTRVGRRNHDFKMEALDDWLRLSGASSVLEVGAGSGMHLEWIRDRRPSLRYLGVDLSDGMLREAHRRGFADGPRALAVSDALALAARPGFFDAAFAVDVVHHVPDPVAMLREMSRAVRPGGTLAVLEPNWVFPVNLIYLARPVEWGVFRSRAGNLRRWALAGGWTAVRVVRLPIYFPPFPERFFPAYGWFERGPGSLGAVRYVSTTLGVVGHPPPAPLSTSPGDRSSGRG